MNFNFITDESLREMLASDYAELGQAMSAGAWKAVHVLAGSIIEALLVEYLSAIQYQDPKGKDLLKFELADLISISKDQGLLSDRAEQLSTVVRGYRNLIHPGRLLRLKEKVSKNSAQVASALVDMIAEEISEKRKETYGYTAEQLVDKVVSDRSALAILDHLLKTMQPREIERLLLKVLPERYFEFLALLPDQPVGLTLRALADVYRPAFEKASETAKKKATLEFVRVLREESEAQVLTYEEEFFQCRDLEYLDDGDRTLVKAHILSLFTRKTRSIYPDFVGVLNGIGAYLTTDEASQLAIEVVNTIVRSPANAKIDPDSMADTMGRILYPEVDNMSPPVKEEFITAYDNWHRRLSEFGNGEDYLASLDLVDQVRGWWTPF